MSFDEKRGLQVEPGSFPLKPLSAKRNLGTLPLADCDILLILVQLALIDDRTNMRAGFLRVVDHCLFQPFDHGFDERVVDALGDNQTRGRSAALSCREERAVDGAFDGGS